MLVNAKATCVSAFSIEMFQLTSEDTCVKVESVKISPVNNVKDAPVTVYRYYEPCKRLSVSLITSEPSLKSDSCVSDQIINFYSAHFIMSKSISRVNGASNYTVCVGGVGVGAWIGN